MSNTHFTTVHPDNPDYSVDPQNGFWVHENAGVMITLNKKFSSDADIESEIQAGSMSVLIFAISDRVINNLDEKGGRITFTMPKCLFCKRVTSIDIDRSLSDRPNLPEHITQRAPGKNFLLVLDENLPMSKRVMAVKRLAEKPIIVKLIYTPQPNTRRICFKVMAPEEWVITQKHDQE